MELEAEEVFQTRQSQRQRVKTSKAIELEKTNREANAPWSGDENGTEAEPVAPGAPRPNRTRSRTQPTHHAATTSVNESQGNDNNNVLTAVLAAIENIRVSNDALHASNAELRESNTELTKSNTELTKSNEILRNGLEELKTQTKKLTEEVIDVKAQLAEARTQWADMVATVNTLPQFGSPAGGSGTSRDGSSPQTYASVLTNSINPSSSASQPTYRTTSSGARARGMLPGVTVDTRRMKDKSRVETNRIPDTEKLIKEVIQATETIKDIQIAGIQVRGHHVRVLTSSEKDAALLRTHDRWVNEVFEGARTRGEDWHPIKIDDVVKATVVKKDGRTIKDDFAQTFCAETESLESRKHFGFRKATKQRVRWRCFWPVPTKHAG